MKIGVLSDIHSNAVALEVVLSRLEDANVEGYICAGDVVGYYSRPNETISMLREVNALTVRGNHDKGVIKETPTSFNYYAKRSLDWNRRKLTEESLRFLRRLPPTIRTELGGRGVFIAHGSPRNPITEYIQEEDISEKFLNYSFDRPPEVVVLGHTHKPYVKRVGDTLVLNPGSVGQPRDSDPRASFAILETEDLSAEIRRAWYNIDEIAEHTKEYLPRKLSDRLYEGK